LTKTISRYVLSKQVFWHVVILNSIHETRI